MRAKAVTSNFGHVWFLRITLASIVFAVAILLGTASRAAESSATDATVLRKELNSVYAQLLRKPSDINLTLKYADLAVSLGDYEAAIPPLERLVMLDPTLYRTKLKLGTFYEKLGSKVVARSYYEDVAKDAAAPGDVKTQAKQYLSKL